jgi:hypothetical protein
MRRALLIAGSLAVASVVAAAGLVAAWVVAGDYPDYG